MTTSSVCPLDEVAEAPTKAASLSLDAALTLLARGGAVCEVLRARVGALQASPAITAPADGADEWLTLEEAGRHRAPSTLVHPPAWPLAFREEAVRPHRRRVEIRPDPLDCRPEVLTV